MPDRSCTMKESWKLETDENPCTINYSRLIV